MPLPKRARDRDKLATINDVANVDDAEIQQEIARELHGAEQCNKKINEKLHGMLFVSKRKIADLKAELESKNKNVDVLREQNLELMKRQRTQQDQIRGLQDKIREMQEVQEMHRMQQEEEEVNEDDQEYETQETQQQKTWMQACPRSPDGSQKE